MVLFRSVYFSTQNRGTSCQLTALQQRKCHLKYLVMFFCYILQKDALSLFKPVVYLGEGPGGPWASSFFGKRPFFNDPSPPPPPLRMFWVHTHTKSPLSLSSRSESHTANYGHTWRVFNNARCIMIPFALLTVKIGISKFYKASFSQKVPYL